MAKTETKKITCLRCGYSWYPRQDEVFNCPKCKTSKWNTPISDKKEFGRKRKIK